MKHKILLKDLLVQKGLAVSTAEAERLILAGQVRMDGAPVLQAGTLVPKDAPLEVLKGSRYVSRGGFKLEGALDDFAFDPAGKRCIDVGTSSGGFTDCLLQRGAVEVVSVDVGYGQFSWKLRQDPRVTLFERTNIARVTPEVLGAPFEVAVVDVSFTSLSRLASSLAALIPEQGSMLSLVKPQFELPKDSVKNGVVHRLDLHEQALIKVRDAYEKVGLCAKAMSFSHLVGPKGNIEFWIWATKERATATINPEQVVRLAHAELSTPAKQAEASDHHE